MRAAGVLWLQLTGGEPLIDKLFPDVYRLAAGADSPPARLGRQDD